MREIRTKFNQEKHVSRCLCVETSQKPTSGPEISSGLPVTRGGASLQVRQAGRLRTTTPLRLANEKSRQSRLFGVLI